MKKQLGSVSIFLGLILFFSVSVCDADTVFDAFESLSWWSFVGTGASVTPTLVAGQTLQAMNVAWTSVSGWDWGVGKNVSSDWTTYTGVKFYLKGDGKQERITFTEKGKAPNISADGEMWEYILTTATGWTLVTVPFTSFTKIGGYQPADQDNNNVLNVNNLKYVSLTGNGTSGSGSFDVDEFYLVSGGSSNQAPATPSTPAGSATGTANTPSSYTTSATDPDGNQVKYAFDWGDGAISSTTLAASGATGTLAHTWVSAGTYSVKARAVDSNEAVSGWSTALSVVISASGGNQAPATPSTPSGLATGSVSTSYSYTTSATDPDGNQVKYAFDWGDGAISSTTLAASGATGTLAHTWTSAGTYSVKARAVDSNEAVSGWSTVLSVTISAAGGNQSPATPSTPSGSTAGTVSTSYNYTTSATDPDGNQVKYAFDWGDGAISSTTLAASGATGTLAHTWVSAGTYSVKARAVDSNEAVSAWSTVISVTISAAGGNQSPATPATPSGSATGTANTSYSYTTSATDPDGNQVKYAFDWGDGSISSTTLAASGATGALAHTWVSSGTYSVKAKAIDSNAAESGWSTALSVTIAVGSTVTTIHPDKNPFNPAKGDKTVFKNLAGGDKVKIYTLNGELVTTLDATNGQADWLGIDKDGKTLPSGVYFYIAGKKKGKIVIMK